MKTKSNVLWITTVSALFMAVFLGSCKDENVEVVGLCPAVVSTNPANTATAIPLNQVITIKFNEKMDPATFTAASVTLQEVAPVIKKSLLVPNTALAQQGTISIAGKVSFKDSTATFTPSSPLKLSTTYSGRITSTVKDLMGNALPVDYVWSFRTGVWPVVVSTIPVNMETNVAVNQVITATFKEAMNPLTINQTSFTVMVGTTPISGLVTYSGKKATFTPSSNLLLGTYTVTITTEAENLAGIPLANDYVWSFTTNATIGAAGVNLKSVAQFGIIAGVGVSNNAGFSEIHNMNVGICPGVRSSITGFPPAIVVNGSMYASDDLIPDGVPAMLIKAKQDLVDAYLFAEGATFPAPATVSGDIGGMTLVPGIYKSTSTLLIQSGNLTLDAKGDANAVWIFQIASDFTTIGGAGGNVILSGGAQAKNIFWQTGRSATIGDFTLFKGNILALTSITMNSGATVVGRMLARNGSVVMTSANIIDKP